MDARIFENISLRQNIKYPKKSVDLCPYGLLDGSTAVREPDYIQFYFKRGGNGRI